jgi:hypothetical protein
VASFQLSFEAHKFEIDTECVNLTTSGVALIRVHGVQSFQKD